MKKILISGGTGMIGTALGKALIGKGYEVAVLDHKTGSRQGIRHYAWNPAKGEIETGALKGVDAIINLAGANIFGKRWTDSYKKEIHDSRVNATRLLVEQLLTHEHQVRTFISTSATGYYGDSFGGPAIESDPPATTFLAQVCVDWEKEAQRAEAAGIRTVITRFAPVVAPQGGFIEAIAKPIRYFVGAGLGSGRQRVSWIHIDDLCAIIIKALEDESMQGAYNFAAPDITTNSELTHKIAKRIKRPILLPNVPAFALRIALGEMADSLVLGSQEASGHKVQQAGYRFRYPDIDSALDSLYPPRK